MDWKQNFTLGETRESSLLVRYMELLKKIRENAYAYFHGYTIPLGIQILC